MGTISPRLAAPKASQFRQRTNDMAVQIQMAQPADLAGAYLKGVQTRAAIQEAKARVAQEQQAAAMRFQAESQQRAQQAQQFQQEQAVEQQRIQVQQAYHKEQMDLRKQQLDEVEKMNEQKTQQAARTYDARTRWQAGIDKIRDTPNLSEADQDKQEAQWTMRMAPEMGIAGTEAASMLKDMRPEKATVPASVDMESNPDFAVVTQPNGSLVLHPKPKAGSEGNVTVALPDPQNPSGQTQVYRTVPKNQAAGIIANLPPELQTNAVNRAALGPAPTAQTSKAQYSTPSDVGAAYKSHKITRDQAAQILQDQFGFKGSDNVQ